MVGVIGQDCSWFKIESWSSKRLSDEMDNLNPPDPIDLMM